ncbi:serine/threonine protein kinase [Actinomadura hallensis]|uniref:non-specific serine/threonine protein kinase n=1 Tax=Actinomadura hallensis TaxID=337895 RepID=A0A543I881_9ACTN|nr:serine/threonine-protein kinase [Actinomadura hallensis]TQM66814.1 serine/threonine protein kinase [Actinomadura hallensis]
MPIVGDHFQRPTYKILRTIGEGNVGICRLARHDIFERDVVQKTISLLGIPDGVAREPHLLKEARHKHLIEVWDAQWEPAPEFQGLDAVTFICDYYPGGSIYNALMDRHEFGLGGALRICGQILDALEYLHRDREYVHRDVKPGNILLDQSRENAVLADLGSAGRIDPITGRTCDYGGTPLYLAPEAKSTGYVTAKSDLYSLGVVTVEMLAGRFPYEQIEFPEVDARLAAGKRALVDRFYKLPPHVPRNVRKFVGSLLQVDPAKRPDTARAALRKLNALEYVDWRRTSGEGLIGEWVGTWPLSKLPAKRRHYCVQATEVIRGRQRGKVRLEATWRNPDGSWRRIRKLSRYMDAGDTAVLASFFRDVESVAHASPA